MENVSFNWDAKPLLHSELRSLEILMNGATDETQERLHTIIEKFGIFGQGVVVPACISGFLLGFEILGKEQQIRFPLPHRE